MTLYTIRDFYVNDDWYRHAFDYGDSSCHLLNEANETLLHYDANGDVRNKHGGIIGWVVLNDDHWYFVDAETHEETKYFSFDLMEGLLDSEVEFSKIYIQTQEIK